MCHMFSGALVQPVLFQCLLVSAAISWQTYTSFHGLTPRVVTARPDLGQSSLVNGLASIPVQHTPQNSNADGSCLLGP